MALPSMQELFYGYNEPTWIVNNIPLEPPRMPQYYPRPYVPRSQDVRHPRPFVPRSQDVVYPRPFVPQSQDVIRPLRRSNEVPVTVVSRPGGTGGPPVSTVPSNLLLRVPLCCEKCIQKVTKALYELNGVQSVTCDQAEQRVVVIGNVDPERALRKVRRVNKRSLYWNMETSTMRYVRGN